MNDQMTAIGSWNLDGSTDADVLARVGSFCDGNPALTRTLRASVLLPAIKAGQNDAAWRLSTALTATAPKDVLHWADRAYLAGLRDAQPEAVAAVKAALAVDGDDVTAGSRAIQQFLMRKNLTAAMMIADLFPIRAVSSAGLLRLMMLSYTRGDAPDLALLAAQRVADLPDVDLESAAVAADVLIKAGMHGTASRMLERAGVQGSDDARALFEYARASFYAGDAPEAALYAVQEALRVDPDNMRYQEFAAVVLAKLGRAAEALDHILTVPEGRRNPTMWHLIAQLHAEMGDHQRADAAAMQGLTGENLSAALIRRTVALKLAAGDQAGATAVYGAHLERRGAALPADFAGGLQAIISGQVGDTIPVSRMRWLYGQVQGLTPAIDPWEQWISRVNEAAAVDQYVLDWLECRRAIPTEMLDQVDGLAACQDRLLRALDQGNGALLATAHVGLLYGGLAALAHTVPDLSIVASMPNLLGAEPPFPLISTSTQGRGSVATGIMRGLKAGQPIAIAIDGAAIPGKTTHGLFDRHIALSDFVPRLAYKRNVPTFFCSMAFRGGRSVAILDALPHVASDDSEAAFVGKWFAGFTGALSKMLTLYPDSARGTGGFWGNIHATSKVGTENEYR